ncbi:SUMO3 protein, partial [Vireo altiloquus]|nr:SUMO3 protein [Vireo altiloquus]
EGVKAENERIDLKVVGQQGSVVRFRIKRHTRLRKLMKEYCWRQGFSVRHYGYIRMRIMFLFDGQPIKAADTPAQLEMEDEDTVEVYQEQIGGRC